MHETRVPIYLNFWSVAIMGENTTEIQDTKHQQRRSLRRSITPKKWCNGEATGIFRWAIVPTNDIGTHDTSKNIEGQMT